MLMSGITGLEILSALRLEGITTRVVFLAASMQDRDLVRAAAGGAYAVINQQVAPEALLAVLRETAAGPLIPLAVLDGELPTTQKRVMALLSDRERQVVDLVSWGLSNKEVARRLSVSEGTVKVHLHRVYQKLSVSNRTMLAVSAALVMQDRDQQVATLRSARVHEG
jgi:two-component system nitrate/nitrite response regulator NarL